VDFKTACIMISFLALGAGIVKGWSDAEKKKHQPGSEPGGIAATGTLTQDPAGITDEFSEPGDAQPRTEDPATPIQEPGGDTEIQPIDISVSSQDDSRLDKIANQIADYKLPQAAREAREMVQDSGGMARELARQLEARIKLLLAMEPREKGKAPALKEVHQANQNVHICTAVEEVFDGYKLKLISGGLATLRKQDVQEVRNIDPSTGRRILLTQLGKRINKLDDPLDFYLRGVRKYYRLGLRDEGYGLLNELLEKKDSDLVLSVLGEEEAENLLPYWNLSNGSGVAALKRRAELRSEEIAASPPPHLVASKEPASTTSPREPVVASKPPPRQRPKNPRPAKPAPRLTSADNSSMQEIRQLIKKADTYYVNARRDEKKRGDFKKAYQTLRTIQARLNKLPSTEETRRTRAQVSTRMLDVSKSLGFFD